MRNAENKYVTADKSGNEPRQDIRSGISFVVLVFSLLILQILLPHILHAEVSMKTTVDKVTVPVGDTLEVQVELEWLQTEGNDIFVVHVDPPASKSLELLNSRESTASKLTSKGPVGARSLRYTFRAKEVGEATLDSVLVEYISSPDQKDPNSLRGQSVQIKIISRSEGIFKKLLFVVAVGAGFLVIVGIPVFLWKKGAFESRSKAAGGPAQFALEKEKLAKLNDIRMFQVSGEVMLLYADVEQLLIDYIESKYKVSVRGKTASEFETIGKTHSIPAELMNLYDKTVHVAEQVRFGGYYPSKDEQEKFLRDVELYFKSLIPKVSEENEIETIDK